MQHDIIFESTTFALETQESHTDISHNNVFDAACDLVQDSDL
jgi:hypothetical protein